MTYQELAAALTANEALKRERDDAVNRSEQDRQRNIRFTNAIVEARTERDQLRTQLEETERHLTVACEERTRAQNDAAALRDQLEASRAECERLKRDKERLDWLEEQPIFIDSRERGMKEPRLLYRSNADKRTLRDAIDAAMQPASGEEGL